ncbi:MAG TPA: glycosyltransferase N-terminal domain-containing protein, partial [Campylobacterales bacterium]|nr:glycosyltransferase N-terminal domain-containing protein [Campylobacterales bacterium]
ALKIGENSRFLPYEMFLPFWIKPVKLLVVMEAELWLALFVTSKLKGAKTALINARISDRSYPKYKRFSFFYRAIFSFVDAVFAQSETDKARLESLGAKNVFVVGNIKQSISGYEAKEIKTDEKQNFTAASTHEGEEELIAKAFLDAELCRNARLIVVPRHPERFETVYSYLSKFASQNSLSISRFSEDETLFADIVLVDKIGELISIYAKSYLVVLGGAFAKIGGHNPMEPAYFGAKLISGTHIFNQKSSFEKVKNAYFCEPSELLGMLKNHQELQKSELFGLSDAMGEVEKGLRELLCR